MKCRCEASARRGAGADELCVAVRADGVLEKASKSVPATFTCLKVGRLPGFARECALSLCDCYLSFECFEQETVYCFLMRLDRTLVPEGGESYTCTATAGECEKWRSDRREDAIGECVEMRTKMMPTD